jgi:hypothetical protein
MHDTTTTSLPDPRPTDSPFLLAMLVAGRRSGDRMLERLARDWLAEIGIRVELARDKYPRTPADRRGVTQ